MQTRMQNPRMPSTIQSQMRRFGFGGGPRLDIRQFGSLSPRFVLIGGGNPDGGGGWLPLLPLSPLMKLGVTGGGKPYSLPEFEPDPPLVSLLGRSEEKIGSDCPVVLASSFAAAASVFGSSGTDCDRGNRVPQFEQK